MAYYPFNRSYRNNTFRSRYFPSTRSTGYSFANRRGNTGTGWYRVTQGLWRKNGYLEVRFSRQYRNWGLYRYGRFVRSGSFYSLTMNN